MLRSTVLETAIDQNQRNEYSFIESLRSALGTRDKAMNSIVVEKATTEENKIVTKNQNNEPGKRCRSNRRITVGRCISA